MLYVSLPFLKGHLPFLKGHTLIPKAKIQLSFGLPKVSLVFGGILGLAGNDVGEIPGQARNDVGATLEGSTAGVTRMARNVICGVLEDFSTRWRSVEMTKRTRAVEMTKRTRTTEMTNGQAWSEWSGTKSASGDLECGRHGFVKWGLPRLNA